MSEVQEHTNAMTEPTQKKKKGFLSNLLNRSNADKSPEGEGSKNKSSAMDKARQAATKEVMHVAEHEAMKQVEGAMNNDGTTSNATPDTETTPTDVVDNATSWAKRMMNSAQQKVQSLQNIGS